MSKDGLAGKYHCWTKGCVLIVPFTKLFQGH